jgi:hypothetical protein
MAHWPVKKSKAVLTGLWKLCARMGRRIVNDTLGDTVGDAWTVSVVLKGVPHDCAISYAVECGTSCGSSVVSFTEFLSDILRHTPGFQMVFGEGSDAMWGWSCERIGMFSKWCARISVSSAAGGRVPLRADSPRALSCLPKC